MRLKADQGASIHTFPSLGQVSEDGCKRNITPTFSCAATRSGNGLAGSQAGQQVLQSRHGIADPGPVASLKGRTGLLDPAGATYQKNILPIVFGLRSVLFTL